MSKREQDLLKPTNPQESKPDSFSGRYMFSTSQGPVVIHVHHGELLFGNNQNLETHRIPDEVNAPELDTLREAYDRLHQFIAEQPPLPVETHKWQWMRENDIRENPIDSFFYLLPEELPVYSCTLFRAMNALHRGGIYSISDLVSLRNPTRLRNVGEKVGEFIVLFRDVATIHLSLFPTSPV